MTTLTAGLYFVLAVSISQANEIILPDVGLPEPYLVSLGTNAKVRLLDMLSDPSHEGRFNAIAQRLSGQDGTGKDEVIARGLRRFIERQSVIDREVESSTIEALAIALRTVGQRGGKDGTDYLLKWVETPSLSEGVHCRPRRGSVAKVRFQLVEAATIGLGLSGDSRVLPALKKLKENPPITAHPRSFLATLDEAIESNLEIQKSGIDSYYKKKREGRRRGGKGPVK